MSDMGLGKVVGRMINNNDNYRSDRNSDYRNVKNFEKRSGGMAIAAFTVIMLIPVVLNAVRDFRQGLKNDTLGGRPGNGPRPQRRR